MMPNYQEAAYKHSHKVRDDARKHLDKKMLDSGHILSVQKRALERLPKI